MSVKRGAVAIDQNELPERWESRTLDKIATMERGITFPAAAKQGAQESGSIACLRTANVQNEIEWDDLIYVPREYVRKQDKLIRESDILISMANSLELVGKVAFIEKPQVKSTFGGFLSAIRANENVIPKFLFYLLRSRDIQEQFRSTASRSVNIANLSLSGLNSVSLPIPPLPEQQTIVSKIEALFAEVGAARTGLERTGPLLKKFRQSVLSAAFRGELTERDQKDEPASALLERIRAERIKTWEEGLRARGKVHSKAKYVEAEPANSRAIGELPEGWAWTTLGDLAHIRNGVTKGRDLTHFDTVELPYLRVANVQDGYLNLDVIKMIKIKENEVEKYKVKRGDVLFTEGGDRDKLGRGTVWRGEIDPCLHQNHIHCARLYSSDILPEWISLASTLRYARDYFWNAASQTVNLASLNASNLKAFVIPIAPTNEQRRIMKRVESLFAQAEEIERAVEIAQRQTDRMEQAILARAFRGEL